MFFVFIYLFLNSWSELLTSRNVIFYKNVSVVVILPPWRSPSWLKASRLGASPRWEPAQSFLFHQPHGGRGTAFQSFCITKPADWRWNSTRALPQLAGARAVAGFTAPPSLLLWAATPLRSPPELASVVLNSQRTFPTDSVLSTVKNYTLYESLINDR